MVSLAIATLAGAPTLFLLNMAMARRVGLSALSANRTVMASGLLVAFAILLTDGPLGPWIGIFVAVALIAWMTRARNMAYRFGFLIVGASVIVPLIWGLIGVAHGASLRQILDESLHFLVFLVYFPLRWSVKKVGAPAGPVWFPPVFALCAVTIALWLGHEVRHLDYRHIKLPFLLPALAASSPVFYRPFLKGHLFLIPASALLWSRFVTSSAWLDRTAVGLIVILITAGITSTRGLWAAILLTVVVVSLMRLSSTVVVRLAGASLAVALILLLTPAGSYLAARVSGAFSPAQDVSAAIRVAESRELLAGFSKEPILGAGLGAALAPDFVRDPAKPYLYELTYHQLLFQLGIIGTLAFLAPIVAGILYGLGLELRRDTRRDSRTIALAAIGTSSLLGLALASATNPYLISAYGAIIVGLSLAIVESALDSSDERTAQTSPPRNGTEVSSADVVKIGDPIPRPLSDTRG